MMNSSHRHFLEVRRSPWLLRRFHLPAWIAIFGGLNSLALAQEDLPPPPVEIVLGPSSPPPVPVPTQLEIDPWLEDPNATDDVVPMVQGPLHEAFAERFNIEDEDPTIVSKEPPPEIDELPPDARPEGDNVQWIPGYWGWDIQSEDFVWVSGFWRQIPPNQRWIPGYWTTADGGWIWVNGFWSADSTEQLLYLPPPPSNLDVGPNSPAPNENFFWIPGNWVYTTGNYRWQPGFWSPGQQDWIWVPARYVWTPSGYLFRNGYWDYTFADRGLLFAPVTIRSGYRGVYRPYYAIETGPVLLANLYVTPGFNNYFFGQPHAYKGSRTILPWVSFYRHGYDPLLSYFAYQGQYKNYLRDISQLNRRIASHPEFHSSLTVNDHRMHYGKGPARHGEFDFMLRVAPVTQIGRDKKNDFETPFRMSPNPGFAESSVALNVKQYNEFAGKRRELERANDDADRSRSKWRPDPVSSTLGLSTQPKNEVVLKNLKLGSSGTSAKRNSLNPDNLTTAAPIRFNASAQNTQPIRNSSAVGKELRTKRLDELLQSNGPGLDSNSLDIQRLRKAPNGERVDATKRNQSANVVGGRMERNRLGKPPIQDTGRTNINQGNGNLGGAFNPLGNGPVPGTIKNPGSGLPLSPPNLGRPDLLPRNGSRPLGGPGSGSTSGTPNNSQNSGPLFGGSGMGGNDGRILGGRNGGSVLPRSGGNNAGTAPAGTTGGPGTPNDKRGPGRRDGNGAGGGLLPGSGLGGSIGPPPGSSSGSGKTGDSSRRGRRDKDK